MYREAIAKLEKWKNSGHRKPLILRGARQVGKTWLMREFGKNNYKNAPISVWMKMKEWRTFSGRRLI